MPYDFVGKRDDAAICDVCENVKLISDCVYISASLCVCIACVTCGVCGVPAASARELHAFNQVGFARVCVYCRGGLKDP